MVGVVGLYYDSEVSEEAMSSQNIFSEMVERLSHRGTLKEFQFELSQGKIHLGIINGNDNQHYLENHQKMKLLLVDNFAVDLQSEERLTKQIISSLRNPKAKTTPSIAHMLVAVGVTDEKQIRIFRSLDGVRTLYFAELDSGFAFSTERKAIWKIFPTEPQVLNPGWILSISEKRDWELFQIYSRSPPKISTKIDAEIQLIKLHDELARSFRNLSLTSKCGVLFSGGVDSSLVAILAKRECEDTLLITAASAHSKDFKKTKEIASTLSIEHKLIQFDFETVWEILPEVIYAIETSKRMDVEIAIPFYLAAEAAKEEDCKVLVSGQGPDELFAGYARYEKSYMKNGAGKVREELWSDFSVTHEVNIARDEKAIAYHGLESFFPYLDQKFSDIALSTPIEFLLNPNRNPSRKILFRDLARKMGLPDHIANAQKHATQYSSGSSKVLQKSVAKNVPNAHNLSKKKTSILVQNVLDTIAQEIGIPMVIGLKTNLDMEPTYRLLERVGPLPTRNRRRQSPKP